MVRGRLLALTVTTAVLVLIGTSTAVLVFDPRVTSAEALRTGGLAAGSVVALYALWLNDRKRRVDEQRQTLEQHRQELDRQRYALEQQRQALEDQRTTNDRDRAADERFARAVELLGHEADQVRVGAMHALAGLALSQTDYTQTVLDVLCSYLRRPFDHPKWTPLPDTPDPHAPDEHWPHIAPELERERQTRQTAQRLIVELLPTTDQENPPIYNLDLTRAWLERFNLSDRVVGRIAAFRCRFRHTTNFNRAVLHGSIHLRDSVFLGRIRCDKTRFLDHLELRGIRTFAPSGFDGAEFRGDVDLKHVGFGMPVYARNVTFEGSLDMRHARFNSGLHLRVQGVMPRALLEDTLVTLPDGADDFEVPKGWVWQDSTRGRLLLIGEPARG